MRFEWMKNTEGRPDAVLTMAFVGFMIVAIKILFAGAVIEFNGNKYSFGAPDASVIGALLGPTLGAYVTRRWTEKKYPAKDKVLPPTDDRDDARASIS